jgi:hypothetical protein
VAFALTDVLPRSASINGQAETIGERP